MVIEPNKWIIHLRIRLTSENHMLAVVCSDVFRPQRQFYLHMTLLRFFIYHYATTFQRQRWREDKYPLIDRKTKTSNIVQMQLYGT